MRLPVRSLPLLLLLCYVLGLSAVQAQTVGVVLSGGGAKGMAHVGVLKALEENNIPIDYIAGTSIGALVAGMYASGYSPQELDSIFSSQQFLDMATGTLEDKYTYYFSRKEDDASWASLKFFRDKRDGGWKTSAPTNLISPVPLDFELMNMMAPASAASGYQFDSLMVPFRCNASDIESKETIIFSKGDLGTAIRASMSYPFYLRPLTVNGKLLFDGGMYNNFPADILNETYQPDVLIGSNVSSNEEPPVEDDLLSQVRNMVVSKTDFSLNGKPGVIITPPTETPVFDFTNGRNLIDVGYIETIKYISEIQGHLNRSVSPEELKARRDRFNQRKREITVKDINVEGLNRRQQQYVKRILIQKRQPTVNVEQLKKGYFRVFGDDKIKSIFPTAKYNSASGHFDLNLKIKREKDLILDFGGNFASTPINTAFIGLRYNHLGNSAVTIKANSYFGRLYSSVQSKVRVDFPVSAQFYLEGGFTLNNWNYFRSRSFFFEEERPSYVIQNERYADLILGLPVRNKDRIKLAFALFDLRDEYYQTSSFSQSDTADQTSFDGASLYLHYERNNLNRKLYPSKGTYLSFKAQYVGGEEFNEPGSTSDLNRNFRRLHEWTQYRLTYDNYYLNIGKKLSLGFLIDGVWSNQLLFNNYTATLLRTPTFQPTPESKTLFLESFRALQYGAFGHKFVANVWRSFDFRLEGYVFQPYKYLVRLEENRPDAVENFDTRFFLATATTVFHSPVGPVSVGVNYYHNNPEIGLEDQTPINFLFHFGYIIFNNRVIN